MFQHIGYPSTKQAAVPGLSPRLRIAGVPYPEGAEARHTLVCGATGISRVISGLVAQVRARGERCVIQDRTGEAIGNFYDPARDVLLNPLDARAPRWSPLFEARDGRDFARMAEALIPRHRHCVQEARAEAARRLFAHGAGRLWDRGETGNRALARYLRRADLSNGIHAMRGASGTATADAVHSKNALSIRAMLWDIAGALELLGDSGAPFSIRDWIGGRRDDGLLFLSSRGDRHGTLRGLMTAGLDVAVDALRSRGVGNSARVWVIVEDLASLNAVPGLRSGLAEGPSFGGCFVLGVRVDGALREVYGGRGAEEIRGLCGTRVVLGARDRDAARWAAESLATADEGVPAAGAAEGSGPRRAGRPEVETNRRWIVPPSQLQRLEDLGGYLRLPGPWPVARFRLRDVKRPRVSPRFVGREPGPSAGPGSGGNGAGNGCGYREQGDRESTQRDRGCLEKPAGNGRLNGKASRDLNWC